MGSSPTAPTPALDRSLTEHQPALAIQQALSALHRSRPEAPLSDLRERVYHAIVQRHVMGTPWPSSLPPLDGCTLWTPEALCASYAHILSLRITAKSTLRISAGSDRKTSGSYYTPTSLTRLLTQEALHPVLERLSSPLEVRLCDPACGTGNMLVLAAQQLAEHHPQGGRNALEQIISSAIYGVDLDPCAVSLARLRLWDLGGRSRRLWQALLRNLRCGDALLGASPKHLRTGIPGAAFKPLLGDDPLNCRQLLKHNRARPQTAIDHDTWCAAFFWDKGAHTLGRQAPTSQSAAALPPEAQAEVSRLASIGRFFCWERAFPEVFSRGGFSVILGNPPWEKLKLQDREFFASTHPHISQARTAAERRGLIDDLASSEPRTYARYQAAKRQVAARSQLLSGSGLYPMSAVGELNTYALFIERCAHLLARGGLAALIVKSGILSDFGMRHLLRWLLESGRVASVFDFSNRTRLFPDVVANERFAVLTLQSPGCAPEAMPISVLNQSPETVRDPARLWHLAPGDVASVNPNTHTCPLFQTRADAQLVRDIYRRHPILMPDTRAPNGGWGTRYVRLFDMTNDSALFRTQEQLQHDLGTPACSTWGDFVPVIEGKLFNSFDSRYGDFRGVPPSRRFRVKAEPRHATAEQKSDPSYQPLPRFWAPAVDAQARLRRHVGHVPSGVLCFRDVCRTHTDSRTIRAAICPPHAAGNKAPLLLFPRLEATEHARRSALLLAVMNSFVFDYVARQKFSGGSLNRYVLAQLPVPDRCALQALPWYPADRLLWLSVMLSCVDGQLHAFGAQCGLGAPNRWSEAERAGLRAELDAVMFHVYGLRRAEVVHVLDSFPILARQEVSRLGRFRSKRAILTEFDAITAARIAQAR